MKVRTLAIAAMLMTATVANAANTLDSALAANAIDSGVVVTATTMMTVYKARCENDPHYAAVSKQLQTTNTLVTILADKMPSEDQIATQMLKTSKAADADTAGFCSAIDEITKNFPSTFEEALTNRRTK